VKCLSRIRGILHEDAFFRPYRHKNARYDIWGGLGPETFGADLERVNNYLQPMSGRLSMAEILRINGFSPASIPSTGFATLSRKCPTIGKRSGLNPINCPIALCEATPIASHSLLPARGYSLTRLGLLRQTNKIRKALYL